MSTIFQKQRLPNICCDATSLTKRLRSFPLLPDFSDGLEVQHEESSGDGKLRPPHVDRKHRVDARSGRVKVERSLDEEQELEDVGDEVELREGGLRNTGRPGGSSRGRHPDAERPSEPDAALVHRSPVGEGGVGAPEGCRRQEERDPEERVHHRHSEAELVSSGRHLWRVL